MKINWMYFMDCEYLLVENIEYLISYKLDFVI